MRWLLLCLAGLDLLAGTLLLLWPGYWQEVLHPLAMGTTFYPLQRTGVVWLARALVSVAAARGGSPRLTAAVAMLWAVEVPGDLLVGWRTAGTGPYAAWFWAGRAVVASLVAARLWRGSGKEVR